MLKTTIIKLVYKKDKKEMKTDIDQTSTTRNVIKTEGRKRIKTGNERKRKTMQL